MECEINEAKDSYVSVTKDSLHLAVHKYCLFTFFNVELAYGYLSS